MHIPGSNGGRLEPDTYSFPIDALYDGVSQQAGSYSANLPQFFPTAE